MSMRRLLIVLASVLAFLLSLSACDQAQKPKVSFNNTDVTGLEYAKGFALTDQNGQRRTLEEFRGKLVFVFFGFTHCPDVCPTTLAEMAGIISRFNESVGGVNDETQGYHDTITHAYVAGGHVSK